MGVDKETTDQPRAADTAYKPPPDRPGSSGQPSRAESRAAARAPTETGSGTGERDEERTAEKAQPEKPAPGETSAEDEPAQPQGSDEAEPDAEKSDAPQAMESPEPEDEPVRDDDQGTPRGPRAESRAQAREAQDAGASKPDAPGTSETNTGDTDPFAGLPARADLDPAGAGEVTRDRGDPLAPVNEDQDLREPERSKDSGWKRAMRGMGDDVEEAAKEFTKVNDNAQGVLGHRPPSDYRTGVQHDSVHPGGASSDTINLPSAGLGIVAVTMIGIALKHGVANGFDKIFRRGNDDNR